jgi:5-methyltetrahydrofolate--homocysteine methyltransferase
MDRWQGAVQVAMTDLGGNLDILSTFRPGERLLTDLIDHPDDVKRLLWDAHRMWWKHFEEIDAILRPANPGYTAWTPIFSETPYYMLQCDFCYMIGPKMFEEFVRPELAETCKKLSNPFYHLDGVGQLPHLDSLLAIKELKGVQWVPGTGKPQGEGWPEVYAKIRRAGKLAQFIGDWWDFDKLVAKLGSPKGFVVFGWVSADKRKDAEAFVERYGAV